MIEVASTIALAILSVSALLFLIGMRRGRSLPDRTVALDALLMVVVSGIATMAARTGEYTYLNVVVVVALLAFLGTALVARYIGRRGV